MIGTHLYSWMERKAVLCFFVIFLQLSEIASQNLELTDQVQMLELNIQMLQSQVAVQGQQDWSQTVQLQEQKITKLQAEADEANKQLSKMVSLLYIICLIIF